MNRRALVIGVTDFSSAVIVQQLRAAGWQVDTLDQDPRATLRFAVTDGAQLRSALDGCDAVVDCVMGSAELLRASAQALAEALRNRANRPAAVYLSSMAVYGSSTGRVAEDAPLKADIGAYGAARIAAEQALRAAWPETIILRPGIDYGDGSPLWSVRIARLLRQRRLGDLGAAGDGRCNLVHVRDIALAVERALALPAARGQSFNLAMDPAPTWNEYLIACALSLGATPVRRVTARRLKIESRLLAPPLKVLELLAGRLHLPLPSRPPVPGSLQRLFQQDLQLDSSRAASMLGIRWRELDEALRTEAART